MEHMLKKFKESLEKMLVDQPETKKNEFTNHKIQVSGQTYFLCKALVPSIPEILAVERAVYEGQMPWDYDAFSKEIADDFKSLYLIVRDQDQMIAFVGCNLRYAPKEAHVTNIAVLPAYQEHGIGKALLQTLFAAAKKYDCNQISLEVRQSNVKAQHLYEQLGFKRVASKLNYYADNETALQYIRDLQDIKVKKEWI